MRETDQTDAVVRTGHTVAVGGELFGDGTMTDDDTGNGSGVICAHEDTTRGKGVDVIGGNIGQRRGAVCRKAKETDTIRAMIVTTGVEEANLGTGIGQRAVREKERGVTGSTRHGTVISVGEDGEGTGVVCLRQSTE
jgi:hypothetical protein